VSSAPGQGTSFKIFLPRIGPTAVAPTTPSLHEVPRGTETILLAEDEAAARSMLQTALQALGYTVLAAAEGEEALRLCREHQGPIHLLVTDVVMPRMSGRQLAEGVAALRPDTRVLYLSGYTDDAMVRHGVLETGMAFLPKPFTPSLLARRVRELLDARKKEG